MQPHVEWGKLLLQWINFGVLLFLLIRYGGRGIRENLRTRHFDIKKNIDEAQALRAKAEQKLAEVEQRLGRIDQEISRLTASLRQEAEAERAQILAAAQAAAERMKREAELVLQREMGRIERELRSELATLAVEAARKLIAAGLNEADEKRLAENFLRNVSGTDPQGGSGGPVRVAEKDWEVTHGN